MSATTRKHGRHHTLGTVIPSAQKTACEAHMIAIITRFNAFRGSLALLRDLSIRLHKDQVGQTHLIECAIPPLNRGRILLNAVNDDLVFSAIVVATVQTNRIS